MDSRLAALPEAVEAAGLTAGTQAPGFTLVGSDGSSLPGLGPASIRLWVQGRITVDTPAD